MAEEQGRGKRWSEVSACRIRYGGTDATIPMWQFDGNFEDFGRTVAELMRSHCPDKGCGEDLLEISFWYHNDEACLPVIQENTDE